MDLQLVRLDNLVKDILIRAQLHHPGQDIQAQIDDPIKTIYADPGRLAQVLENLISNAAKYAPNAPILIRVSDSPGGVSMEVIDHGVGIAEKYQSKIFDRFFRIPAQGSSIHGTGLGLFICKQIIQAHSGNIQLISKVGEGSNFKIFLPAQS